MRRFAMSLHRIAKLAIIAVLLISVAALAIWAWIQWRYDRLVLTDVAAAPRSASSAMRSNSSAHSLVLHGASRLSRKRW
jgi:hypothetical protein